VPLNTKQTKAHNAEKPCIVVYFSVHRNTAECGREFVVCRPVLFISGISLLAPIIYPGVEYSIVACLCNYFAVIFQAVTV